MKQFFLFFAAAVSLLALNSCNDHDLADVKPDVPSVADVDYLVMHYGAGGGNLDNCIISNIVQAIDEGGNDKVAMTFQYKPSKKLQKDQSLENFNGVRRFTLKENAHLQGQFKSMSKDYPLLDKSSFNYYAENIKSEKVGGSDYDMSSVENLAEFISWSKKKYPKAKRTILVITGHGNGWGLADGKAQFQSQSQSRVILPDDNLENKYLKAVDVVNGVNKAGGVDLFYADACLMSMYENIYTYANAFKYMLATGETTPGLGGDYRKLLNLLKSADTTDAAFEGAMRKFADYCISDQWWGKPSSSGNVRYCDFGLYNLSKLGTLTPVMQKIASTLTEKFTGTESIEPTADELPYSDKFAPYIRRSALQCVMLHREEYIEQDSLPAALLPYISKDLHADSDNTYSISMLIEWVKYAQFANAQAAYEAYPEEWEKLRRTIVKRTYFTFSLTDFLSLINTELNAVGAQNNPFGRLHDDLVSALKSIAYIACSEPEKLPVEQAYEYCSPGIFIVPFNESYNTNSNPYNTKFPNLEESLSYYQVSDFDKAVGWSSFLKVLDVIPSVLHNPGRKNLILLPDGTVIR